MGKKSNKNSDLGRAIARKQQQRPSARAKWNTPEAQIAAAVGRHTNPTDANPAHTLTSVLDASDLDELMLNATLANQSFAAQRRPTPLAPQSVVVVTPLSKRDDANVSGGGGGGGGGGDVQKNSSNLTASTSSEATVESRMRQRHQLDRSALRIPRRPPGYSKMTYDALMTAETETFLQWRRKIATLEEEYALSSTNYHPTTITPFEKNLQVWRQLWRVVERSDIILQIVDARNPLLYLCDDLVRYVVQEMGRKHVLVMNKADLLTSKMIGRWGEYFARRGVEVLFFSAFKASVGEAVHDERIMDANGLIERLNAVTPCAPIPRSDGRIVVGLCGYPNVGKSSTINVLLETAAAAAANAENSTTSEEPNSQATGNDDGKDDNIDGRSVVSCVEGGRITTGATKRVAVSATPGKTKHFQTLVLTDHVMLCDCPGLVFPNFSASKAELICAGVLPIDNMRGDYETPVSLMAQRIPAATWEAMYGLRLPVTTGTTVSGSVLLEVHARARGFMTDHGRADRSRSARIILKDFVNGRVVFAHGPPREGGDGDGGGIVVVEEGESGLGAAVFAKKGRLMHERMEAREHAALSVSVADEGTGLLTAGEDDMGGGAVRAMVSASKKGRGKEFVRVERTFYPNA